MEDGTSVLFAAISSVAAEFYSTRLLTPSMVLTISSLEALTSPADAEIRPI